MADAKTKEALEKVIESADDMLEDIEIEREMEDIENASAKIKKKLAAKKKPKKEAEEPTSIADLRRMGRGEDMRSVGEKRNDARVRDQ